MTGAKFVLVLKQARTHDADICLSHGWIHKSLISFSFFFNAGMSLMMQVAGELKIISKDLNVAVLVGPVLSYVLMPSFSPECMVMSMMICNVRLPDKVTNHATRDGSGQLRAGLGQSWSHVPRTRILLRRVERPGSSSSLRVAILTKSSRQVKHFSVKNTRHQNQLFPIKNKFEYSAL